MRAATKVSHLDLIEQAKAERDAGIALAIAADRDGWDCKVIYQAIAAFAGTGDPFSANDIRPLLPDVRRPLIGACFLNAYKRGEIQMVNEDVSTKRNTHGKKIGRWIAPNHNEMSIA